MDPAHPNDHPKPAPDKENCYLAGHAALMLRSLRQLAGIDLVEGPPGSVQAAKALYEAPFFVASHNAAEEPVLTYGNRVAQRLFEMSWEEFTRTPSRFTAEAPARAERARLLQRVTEHGFIDDYSGVRISKGGQRFLIEGATVWNLLDERGTRVGQAATFSSWRPLD